MSTSTVLPSRNEALGFFGTVTACPLRERQTREIWHIASNLIARAVRAESEEERLGVRDFLDSRMGRHFADDVVGALHAGADTSEEAIATAIQKWQGWRISRATQREDGIRAGLPYLTGWVQHFAVMASVADPA